MGYAFLLAFTKFFPFQVHVIENQHLAPVLDELPWRRSPEAVMCVEKWVEDGGWASLQSVGNICDQRNFDILKQIALKSLQDLKVWGLVGKFYRTVKNFK